MKYDFKQYEPKWQKKWEEAGAFRAEDHSEKPKYYNLVEFPYPSGHGMRLPLPISFAISAHTV